MLILCTVPPVQKIKSGMLWIDAKSTLFIYDVHMWWLRHLPPQRKVFYYSAANSMRMTAWLLTIQTILPCPAMIYSVPSSQRPLTISLEREEPIDNNIIIISFNVCIDGTVLSFGQRFARRYTMYSFRRTQRYHSSSCHLFFTSTLSYTPINVTLLL